MNESPGQQPIGFLPVRPEKPGPTEAGRFAGRETASAARSRLREILARTADPRVISFAIGLPAEDLFPVRELAEAQARVLPAMPSALQYGVPCEALKRQIVELMALRGVVCRTEHVFLTSGAQQGMDLVARLLLEPGDEVLLEETVFEGIRLAAERQRARLLTVATDLETGLDPAAVAAALKGGASPRFLYTIPAGHNPLGVDLTLDKRCRLIDLARELELTVLEDDAYGFLSYDPAPAPPLRALEERRVFYLGSFSKVLAPALRAGWLVVPEELTGPLGTLKHGADLDTATLGHRVVSAYLRDNSLAEHLVAKRVEYRRRRDIMLGCLAASMPPGARWTRPASGMFVWVELPPGIDTAVLLETAIAEGVAFSPGEAFASAGGRHARHCLRLCFTSCPPDHIAEGIRRLGNAVARYLEVDPSGSRVERQDL